MAVHCPSPPPVCQVPSPRTWAGKCLLLRVYKTRRGACAFWPSQAEALAAIPGSQSSRLTWIVSDRRHLQCSLSWRFYFFRSEWPALLRLSDRRSDQLGSCLSTCSGSKTGNRLMFVSFTLIMMLSQDIVKTPRSSASTTSSELCPGTPPPSTRLSRPRRPRARSPDRSGWCPPGPSSRFHCCHAGNHPTPPL